MMKDTLVGFADPAGISADPLTDILRSGARDLLARAIEAEVAALLAAHTHLTDAQGRQRLVRHGHLPEREVIGDRACCGESAPRARSGHGCRIDQVHIKAFATVSAENQIR